MAEEFAGEKLSGEGYVYNSYGSEHYLKYVIASVNTLRRYDRHRPVTLFCSEAHFNRLHRASLTHFFTHIYVLPLSNQSLTGFKHNLHNFMHYEKNLFLDSDIVWCKNPDPLWSDFSSHPFTITGNQSADIFFGGHKSWKIIGDILLGRRRRTLNRFGVTYLSRVQTGMIYARDPDQTEEVCELAQALLQRKELTHFRSRKEEKGRSHESCEWSLALAMAKQKIQVYPWLYGFRSPQLDYIEAYTNHNKDFTEVTCLIYSDRFVYDLKAIKNVLLRRLLVSIFSIMPGKGDHLYVTPYCLHFGWYNQKRKFSEFSDTLWAELTTE